MRKEYDANDIAQRRMYVTKSLFHHFRLAADRVATLDYLHPAKSVEQAEILENLFNIAMSGMRAAADLYYLCYHNYTKEMLSLLDITAHTGSTPTEPAETEQKDTTQSERLAQI